MVFNVVMISQPKIAVLNSHLPAKSQAGKSMSCQREVGYSGSFHRPARNNPTDLPGRKCRHLNIPSGLNASSQAHSPHGWYFVEEGC